MIPQKNLSLLSNRLARDGGRRIPETVLERDYCLAWFLVALSRMPLRKRLIFKGGTALKKCYFGDYRFSEDLDFSTINSPKGVVLENALLRATNISEEYLNNYNKGFKISLSRKPERSPHPRGQEAFNFQVKF